MVEKIISGGQTGADRAALDVALELKIPCGGWCPKGRRAEDGRIDNRYPLQETPSSDYRVRTRFNVEESRGTLVITRGPVTGGTALTIKLAREKGRPLLVIDLNQKSDPIGYLGSTLHYSLKPRVLIESVPQALKVLLQARISPHPCRKSRSVLAQCRDAHPVKLSSDLYKTPLPRKAQAAKLHEHRPRASVSDWEGYRKGSEVGRSEGGRTKRTGASELADKVRKGLPNRPHLSLKTAFWESKRAT